MVYKVYKIYSSLNPKMVYIGSTKKKLKYRYSDHISNYNNPELYNSYVYKIFDTYGVNTCKIELVKICKYNDRKCTEAWEQLAINKFRMDGYDVVNKAGTICIKKMYRKKYREEHKEELREIHKKYYEENKDKYKERGSKYREEHKEEIKEQKKKYRENNKEKINAKTTCELCGLEVVKSHLKRHQSRQLCEQRREQQ